MGAPRHPLPALVLIASCGLPRDVQAQPVDAVQQVACTVASARSDGMGTHRNARAFTRAGQLVSGTGANYYATEGAETFHYDVDGHLIRIESEEGTRGDPANLRTRTTIGFDYDARGLLVRERTRVAAYGQFPTNADRVFTYSATGSLEAQVIEEPRGSWLATTRRTTRYQAGRAQRHEVTMPDGAIGRWTATRDAAGQITAIQHVGCVGGTCGNGDRYEYTHDARGRLVRTRQIASSGSSYAEVIEEWSYDAASRVTRTSRTVVRSGTNRDVRAMDYHYDTRGRLASTSSAGVTDHRYTYRGACDRVALGPEAPSAETLLGTRICLDSPVHVLSTCFEPRTRAIPSPSGAAITSGPSQRPKNYGEGRRDTADHTTWTDFTEREVGFSARFPEPPLRADQGMRTYAWARAEPMLVLSIEVFPVGPKVPANELLTRHVARITNTDEEGEYGDVTHHPAWVKSQKATKHDGHPAIELDGAFAAGAIAPSAITKRGRVIVIGGLVYFVSVMFASTDATAARNATHFLDSFRTFRGSKPPTL